MHRVAVWCSSRICKQGQERLAFITCKDKIVTCKDNKKVRATWRPCSRHHNSQAEACVSVPCARHRTHHMQGRGPVRGAYAPRSTRRGLVGAHRSQCRAWGPWTAPRGPRPRGAQDEAAPHRWWGPRLTAWGGRSRRFRHAPDGGTTWRARRGSTPPKAPLGGVGSPSERFSATHARRFCGLTPVVCLKFWTCVRELTSRRPARKNGGTAATSIKWIVWTGPCRSKIFSPFSPYRSNFLTLQRVQVGLRFA